MLGNRHNGGTSLESDEELAVPLQLPHELFILQEERDALVFQVLLQFLVLLRGARWQAWTSGGARPPRLEAGVSRPLADG